MTEEEGMARLLVLFAGLTDAEDPEREIAAYLMAFQPQEILDAPETPEIALEVARLCMDSVPEPAGIPDIEARLPGPEDEVPDTDMVEVVINEPLDFAFSDGEAGAGSYARELILRARYAINALGRLGRSALGGDDWRSRWKKEANHFLQHRKAQKIREQKLRVLDNLANEYGPILSWRSVLDEGTTPECRDAHGQNFDLRDPPAIGLPGLVHVRCRCEGGAPIQGKPVTL